jgi:hypothetical protein
LEYSESLLPTPAGYAKRATLPLASLVFLLPLIVVYEVGTLYFTTAAREGKDQEIIAFSKMGEFFRLFGAPGRHLPALAVIVVLICSHVFRRDGWAVHWKTIVGMIFESVVLGLPLLGMAFVINKYMPVIGLSAMKPTGDAGQSSMMDRLIMDIGAGVYEEFVFRLALFAILSALLSDVMKLRDRQAYLLMVVISAVLFSAYHYWSPTEHFSLRVFAFRTVAGIYFGMIFLFRGYGITAGSHCAYDAIITLW